MTGKQINVLVVEDNQCVIDGIRLILEDVNGINFAGAVKNADDALAFIDLFPVDVAVTDINLPGKSGIEFATILRDKHPEIKVLALSLHEEVYMIIDMIKAGASGYIFKRADINELKKAINIVAADGKYLGTNAQEVIMDEIRSRGNLEIKLQNDDSAFAVNDKNKSRVCKTDKFFNAIEEKLYYYRQFLNRNAVL